jgi:hypothetical protein
MAIVHPDGWDRPLNKVNWHTIAQYIRPPRADPAQIELTWAREQLGGEAVVKVVDIVTEAARGMCEFDGLWTANHSYVPILEYLDSHMCGPYRQVKRMAGMMGMGLPTDMYGPRRAAEIRAVQRTRMVFNREPITPELKAQAMSQKKEAVRLMDESLTLWRCLEGKVDDETYREILAGQERNRNDTL